MSKKPVFKKDKFTHARDGGSKILDLHCRNCDTVFAVYQKDGSGYLRRMYMDRIVSPDSLVGLQNTNIDDIDPIRCSGCNTIVAMPYIYKKENRNAYRVFRDSVIKRIAKINT